MSLERKEEEREGLWTEEKAIKCYVEKEGECSGLKKTGRGKLYRKGEQILK